MVTDFKDEVRNVLSLFKHQLLLFLDLCIYARLKHIKVSTIPKRTSEAGGSPHPHVHFSKGTPTTPPLIRRVLDPQASGKII